MCPIICNSNGLEVMVAGASEDTGLAKERRRLAFPAEEVADKPGRRVIQTFKPLSAPKRVGVDIITASSLASRALFTATSL
jgi:hypothetical protein